MGVIHAPPGQVAAWTSKGELISKDGEGLLRTTGNWTPVVSGYGYLDIDPDELSGRRKRRYAVGIRDWPDRRWGGGGFTELAEDIAQALNRENNDVVYRAEREILVGWDTVLQAGVLIDRSASP